MLMPRGPRTRIFAEGELLVTGEGDVVIDKVLPRLRPLLVEPTVYITVEFDPCEHVPPPCAGGQPDELDWELFFHTFHHRHHDRDHDDDDRRPRGSEEEELKLRILWSVSTARKVLWKIRIPTSFR